MVLINKYQDLEHLYSKIKEITDDPSFFTTPTQPLKVMIKTEDMEKLREDMQSGQTDIYGFPYQADMLQSRVMIDEHYIEFGKYV